MFISIAEDGTIFDWSVTFDTHFDPVLKLKRLTCVPSDEGQWWHCETDQTLTVQTHDLEGHEMNVTGIRSLLAL